MNALKYLIFVAAVVLPGLAVAASDVSVEIRKQSSASVKAPAAAPVTVGSDSLAVPSTDTKKVGFDAIDGSGAGVSAPTTVSTPQTAKSNESNVLALVLFAALSVVSIVLGAFGLLRTKQLAVRFDVAEKGLKARQAELEDSLEKTRSQTRKRVDEIESGLKGVGTRLLQTESASIAQVASPKQAPVNPPVTSVNAYTTEMVSSALTSAVRTFVDRNVSLSPTEGLVQILKCVKDGEMSEWIGTHKFEYHLIDADGEPTSNGQLVAIGVNNPNVWFVFPRPLSENVPRFNLWFDGDVSKRNVVASKPAFAAKAQGGRFEVKTKGALA